MLDIRQLIWDEWNIAHIARHDVLPDEVEEVCQSQHVEHEAYGGRVMVIGRTQAGRMLSVVLAPYGEGIYYPVTARDASRRERRIYRSERGGESS